MINRCGYEMAMLLWLWIAFIVEGIENATICGFSQLHISCIYSYMVEKVQESFDWNFHNLYKASNSTRRIILPLKQRTFQWIVFFLFHSISSIPVIRSTSVQEMKKIDFWLFLCELFIEFNYMIFVYSSVVGEYLVLSFNAFLSCLWISLTQFCKISDLICVHNGIIRTRS